MLINSQIMSNLLSNQINKIKFKYKYTIIDGFPRDIRNLMAWRSSTAQNNYTIGLFTVITCDESAVSKRMKERLGRSDDANEAAVKERIRIFYGDTKYMLNNSLLPNEKVVYVASQKRTEDTRMLFRKVLDSFILSNKH
jgi:adenylate kinase family enzyme